MEKQPHHRESWPALKLLEDVTSLVLGVMMLKAEDSQLRSTKGLLYNVCLQCLSYRYFSHGNVLSCSPRSEITQNVPVCRAAR